MNRVRESGFTLIELIVTISIMGILIIGLVNLYITVETGQRKSYNIEMATRAGERQIESLRNAQYASLEPGTEQTFTGELPDDLPSPKTGTIQITEPITGVRRVDVTITFKDGGSTRTVKQSSLIGRLGIGQ